MNQGRFNDENKNISEFRRDVLVVCPKCGKKAFTRVDYENNSARLFCENCGYNKQKTTDAAVFGHSGNWQLSADSYFDAELWLKASFKNNVFWAYNLSHLEYLEKYISANLREHKDRSHFTLVEKLPKFYHEAKNREALLKIIERLKTLL